jgi:hypothetical protein
VVLVNSSSKPVLFEDEPQFSSNSSSKPALFEDEPQFDLP